MGKFTIKMVGEQYHFVLKAGNGEVILQSQLYATEETANKGIASVKNNAPDSDIDDTTI